MAGVWVMESGERLYGHVFDDLLAEAAANGTALDPQALLAAALDARAGPGIKLVIPAVDPESGACAVRRAAPWPGRARRAAGEVEQRARTPHPPAPPCCRHAGPSPRRPVCGVPHALQARPHDPRAAAHRGHRARRRQEDLLDGGCLSWAAHAAARPAGCLLARLPCGWPAVPAAEHQGGL